MKERGKRPATLRGKHTKDGIRTKGDRSARKEGWVIQGGKRKCKRKMSNRRKRGIN